MSSKILEGSTWAEPPSLSLTITADSADLQGFLDGPNYREAVNSLREDVRYHLKYGHNFKDPEEALEWVQKELGEVGE